MDEVFEEVGAESSEDSYSDLVEEAALRFYRGVEERLKLKRKCKDPQVEEGLEEAGDEEELDPDAKRLITYKMVKNKGLTSKRKKIDRNPRVKHREKFRRTKIRRKGQVHEVHCEETRCCLVFVLELVSNSTVSTQLKAPEGLGGRGVGRYFNTALDKGNDLIYPGLHSERLLDR
ncbi:hypothetical protein J4Q44_G00101140 [Coregonus suidteri]|uniref:Sas10 C-terminal domain-containing protein n=1 Tax=Coregonus suidteri TaxID=861788 RepID=A0AAN8R160_9TELE